MLLFTVLTVLSQIGGIVLLFCLFIFKYFKGYFKNTFLKMGTFILVYGLSTFVLVPFIARQTGRVPLPIWNHPRIQPAHIGFCLLNRHYVSPELKAATEHVALQLQQKYPNAKLTYLDANFPFWKGFPLLPHRSHDDGKKLDIAFFYQKSGKPTNQKPSLTGYGVFEAPRAGEMNQTEICKSKGHGQYDINKYMAWFVQNDLTFDAERTRTLTRLFAKEKAVRKIFLEPHLKQRLQLSNYAKIRFHGCRAARHDDHIHVQL